MLCVLGVEQSETYRTHDLRRGHADDLRKAGTPLTEFLKAGEWRTPAFYTYLNLEDLQADAAMEAHVYESSGKKIVSCSHDKT